MFVLNIGILILDIVWDLRFEVWNLEWEVVEKYISGQKGYKKKSNCLVNHKITQIFTRK